MMPIRLFTMDRSGCSRWAVFRKLAKIGHDACLEDVRCDPGRGLDKAMLRDLATGRWIDSKLNVIIVGKTGVGKSYLAAALAQAACRHGRRALFARVPRLVHDLASAGYPIAM